METNSVRLRRAFNDSAGYVLELCEQVGESQWQEPGLGEWTLRELFVHTSRAASTITSYVGAAAERTLDSAGDYYAAVLDDDSIHEAVLERTRTQAAEVDEPIPEYLRRVFDEAERTLARTPAAAVLGTPAGGITLEDYLPTRVVELVVHATDIAAALGLQPGVPPAALEVALETLVEVSIRRPGTVDPVRLLRALTGREALAEGSNLLG